MTGTPRALVVQRLLLAGLVGIAALSLLLLLLHSGGERGRGAGSDGARTAAPHADMAAPAAEPVAVSPAAAGEPRDERTELAATPAPGSAPVEEAFDPGAIVGRVVCAGAPVPDVELRLFDGALERRERRSPLATTKSDAAGRFRMSGFEPHARYVVQAQHGELLPDDETFYPGHDQELELERAATVGGTVRALAGEKPLAGIEVALERWHFEPAGMQQRVSVVSDAEGRWRLPWAKPGIETFEVLRPGCLPEEREFQVAPEGGENFTILLDEERGLELEVFALESGTTLADTELVFDGQSVRTDARGRLALPRASGADATVRVSLSLGDGCLTEGRIEPEALRAAGTQVLRVPLARGGTVRGRVLDGDGAPVEGAELRLSGGGRATLGSSLPPGFWLSPARGPARSGADGRFALTGMPPREGAVEVRARHPAHPPGRSESFALARLGQEVEVEIVLEHGATIEGTVTLEGEPAGLRVYWDAKGAGGWTRADDRGAYLIRGVPSGEVRVGARLEDEDEDHARREDQVLVASDGASLTADFALVSDLARIRGRVLDERGEPVAEADVVALVSDTDQEWEGEEPHTESEADGSFELFVPELPGLRFDVVAVRGPRRARAESVAAGASGLELVMPALAAAVLRVVDSLTHEPVPAFHLYWRESDGGSFDRFALGGRDLSPGPDGTFLAELPVGRLDLLVSAHPLGYVPARADGVKLSEGSAPRIELRLERGVELRLELTGVPGAESAPGQLRRARTYIVSDEQWAERERGGAWLHREVRNEQSIRPDSGGVALLEALPSGHYRFMNGPKGFTFRPQEFDVPAVAQHQVKIELVPERKKARGDGTK